MGRLEIIYRGLWAVLLLLALFESQVDAQADPTCIGISKEVSCEQCRETTHRCMPGKVPVNDWLVSAAKTQRELQVDEQWHRVQMLDAHNGYNARAWGYGINDTCDWPPPYQDECDNYANQEFSFTDLLNMGIHALEIDNWYCFGDMRQAHLGSDIDLECSINDRLFSDGIKEIADWLKLPGNEDEMVRIYINEKFDQEHDELVNNPLKDNLGDLILTPEELRDTYEGQWPTIKQMREAGKRVVVATGSTAGSGDVYTHGGKYIHKIYWEDKQMRYFTNYPECGGKNLTNAIRFYSDSTHYWNETYVSHDGPGNGAGVIYDFTEYVKCRVQYPATDMIKPDLVKTALFTWAEGQPSASLTSESCIMIKNTDWRWYLSDDCSTELYYACQSNTDPDDWKLSSSAIPYDTSGEGCPSGYKFSVPQDGFRHQKLKEAAGANSVWINFTPWLLTKATVAPTKPPSPNTTAAAPMHQAASLAVLLSLTTLSIFMY